LIGPKVQESAANSYNTKFELTPEIIQKYEKYYQNMDQNRTGRIKEAVLKQTFQKSKLPE